MVGFIKTAEAARVYLQMDSVAAGILEPVRRELLRLKNTTKDSMPPPNRWVRSKQHVDLVKERLLPIGIHIKDYLRTLEEHKRGAMEMRLCRHIAIHYWPLDPIPSLPDHVRIHEMYHNSIYKRNLRARALYQATQSTGVFNNAANTQDAQSDSHQDDVVPDSDCTADSGGVDISDMKWD